jgi:Fur family ferric uptake transcriptional regulator
MIEEALNVLSRAGLKQTKARHAVLAVLASNEGPFAADEIRKLARGANLDLATVYRCLATFERCRIVRRCEFGDGISRYEYQRGHEHHHHVVCVSCRRAERIGGCAITRLERKARRKGYEQLTHTATLFGICKACRSARP